MKTKRIGAATVSICLLILVPALFTHEADITTTAVSDERQDCESTAGKHHLSSYIPSALTSFLYNLDTATHTDDTDGDQDTARMPLESNMDDNKELSQEVQGMFALSLAGLLLTAVHRIR